MAYIYYDNDGDKCVKFEKGKWDSVMGYYCPECNTYFGDPEEAMEHENTLPCRENPDEYRKLIWKA